MTVKKLQVIVSFSSQWFCKKKKAFANQNEIVTFCFYQFKFHNKKTMIDNRQNILESQHECNKSTVCFRLISFNVCNRFRWQKSWNNFFHTILFLELLGTLLVSDYHRLQAYRNWVWFFSIILINSDHPIRLIQPIQANSNQFQSFRNE